MQENAPDPNDLERRLAALEEFLDGIPSATTLATIRAIVVTLRREAQDAALRGASRELVEQIEEACDEIRHGLRRLRALTLRGDVNEALVRVAAASGHRNGDGRGRTTGAHRAGQPVV
jgi:hypothetical protein